MNFEIRTLLSCCYRNNPHGQSKRILNEDEVPDSGLVNAHGRVDSGSFNVLYV